MGHRYFSPARSWGGRQEGGLCLDKKHVLESPVFGITLCFPITMLLFIYLLVMDRTAAFPVVRISNKK